MERETLTKEELEISRKDFIKSIPGMILMLGLFILAIMVGWALAKLIVSLI